MEDAAIDNRTAGVVIQRGQGNRAGTILGHRGDPADIITGAAGDEVAVGTGKDHRAGRNRHRQIHGGIVGGNVGEGHIVAGEEIIRRIGVQPIGGGLHIPGIAVLTALPHQVGGRTGLADHQHHLLEGADGVDDNRAILPAGGVGEGEIRRVAGETVGGLNQHVVANREPAGERPLGEVDGGDAGGVQDAADIDDVVAAAVAEVKVQEVAAGEIQVGSETQGAHRAVGTGINLGTGVVIKSAHDRAAAGQRHRGGEVVTAGRGYIQGGVVRQNDGRGGQGRAGPQQQRAAADGGGSGVGVGGIQFQGAGPGLDERTGLAGDVGNGRTHDDAIAGGVDGGIGANLELAIGITGRQGRHVSGKDQLAAVLEHEAVVGAAGGGRKRKSLAGDERAAGHVKRGRSIGVGIAGNEGDGIDTRVGERGVGIDGEGGAITTVGGDRQIRVLIPVAVSIEGKAGVTANLERTVVGDIGRKAVGAVDVDRIVLRGAGLNLNRVAQEVGAGGADRDGGGGCLGAAADVQSGGGSIGAHKDAAGDAGLVAQQGQGADIDSRAAGVGVRPGENDRSATHFDETLRAAGLADVAGDVAGAAVRADRAVGGAQNRSGQSHGAGPNATALNAELA